MILFWALAGIVFAFDQWTKHMVLSHLHAPVAVMRPFLYFMQTVNDGAAWGIFSGRRSFLLAISLCVSSYIIFFRKKLRLNLWPRGVAFGLLLGGICGNFLDRLRMGAVIDFIDVRLPFYHWPTFNFADAAICLSVIILFSIREQQM
ncbi:MAG: signal peptidase II [Puniceicoccales bacterium]|jgi:signal peptidase II|nr:signal peptidase II [Puniceicoccales bacterium]